MSPGTAVDLRLFGFAAGTWVSSLVALRWTAGGAWLAAGLAAAGTALVIGGRRAHRPAYRPRHHRPVGVWVVAGVLLGAVCGFAATAARTGARDAPELTAIIGERPSVHVRLTIAGDPYRLAGATVLVPATMTELVGPDGVRVRLGVRVLVFAMDEAWGQLLPSQDVWARGRLGPARGGDLTAAVLAADGRPEQPGAPQWTQLAAGSLRAGLRDAVATLPPQPGGLVPALSIGDTTLLDAGLSDDLRATGLTHLAAVSGANITIVVGFVLLLARWVRAGPWAAAAVALLALAGFVILVRPSASVVRAAAMGAVGLLALVVGRSRVATAALATAVIASLLLDPALAVSEGFLLSVLATGALVLVAPGWRDRLRAAGVPPGLAEALAVPAAAQVVCAPVIAGISGQVSLIALPANLLAAPAVAPITVVGVLAAMVSSVWPDAAGVLAWLGSWPARWLVLVAHAGAAVPAGAIGWASGWPGAISMAVLCAAVWLAVRRPATRRLAVVLTLAVAVGALPVRWFAGGWPPTGAVVVVCDVGQGDAIVLPDSDGSAVVVDAGPDPASVDACLRRLKVAVIDVIVISHFHADHIDGLTGVLDGRAVGGIAVPSFDDPPYGHSQVERVALAASVPIVEIGPGWTFHAGDVDLTVVGPTRARHGTRSDPNNNSLVVVARVHGVSILLPGDAEVEEQGDLLRDVGPSRLRADVLKVAHHGSSYQDTALIDATGARVALVSVGAENPYGHPNAALLANLRDAGMRVLRTDEDGDVAVVLTANGLGVVTSRGGPSG